MLRNPQKRGSQLVSTHFDHQQKAILKFSTPGPLYRVSGRYFSPKAFRQGSKSTCKSSWQAGQGSSLSLRIQGGPKKGINPTILLWGWDWDHQTYSIREGYGSLGCIILYFGSIPHPGCWLVTTRIITFLVGKPNLNLHLQLFCEWGGIPIDGTSDSRWQT